MRTKEFAIAWEELSPIQKKAAEWDAGPLLILAGPGSGKTRVLTCRIGRLLDSSRDKNFRILGLTFTNKAADEMRSRVTTYSPGQEGRLFLGTFHSFCADVLRQHGTHLQINPNFRIYAQEPDLQAVLDAAVIEAKKTSPLVSDLDKKTLPVIKHLKSLLIPPHDCCKQFKNKEFGERMAVVYPAYEAELSKHNALDFHSLILKAHQLFTTFPVLAKRYRTVYQYICIDEFQDTNHAQYQLLRDLTGGQHHNLFIIADDDQIIYQWNGASHKRLQEFLEDFAPQIVQLPTNYRCPPEVVELANHLIRHNFLRTVDKKPLEAFRSDTGKGVVRLLPCFPDFESEAVGVARDIRTRHANELGSVVVLGRNRKLLEGARQALRHEELPAVILQRQDEFVSTPFAWLHAVLRLANDRQDRQSLEAVCGSFSQLTQVDVDPEAVIAQAQASNLGYLQHWITIARQKSPDTLAQEALDKVLHDLGAGRDFRTFSTFALAWFDKLLCARQAASEQTTEVFTGYEDEQSVWEELMREILSSLSDALTLEAFLQELQMRSKEPIPKPDTVTLMTIHGAKGKEFDHVYLIGLVEDELPSFQSKRKGDESPEMEEERRNCFVAITRAIKTLTLSYAEQYKGRAKEPSRFLFDMKWLHDQMK
ncbi:ATP-dependent DNA helicase PcrA [Candidatus Entotheonellaceae bacterium PAL068K]